MHKASSHYPNIISALVILLRIALVVALAGAGWSIYRKLPEDSRHTELDKETLQTSGNPETRLRIILRHLPQEKVRFDEFPVELYPVDLMILQREFFSERRAGLRFDDFVARRMKKRPPLKAQFNKEGQAILSVPPGKWWVHATVSGPDAKLVWRTPVNVAGREQTVELLPERAYMRAKEF